MSHAYAAGLIDGEGYIGIKETSGSYAIRLKIGMTDKAASCLSRLEATYGGRTTPYQPKDANRRQVLEWRLNGQDAASCLRLVRPHLIIKTAIADLALELQDMIDSAPRRGNGQAIWSEEMRRRASVLRLRVMELNQVGPEPVPPTLPAERPLAVYRWGEWWEPDEDLFGPVEFTGRFPTSGQMIAGHIYPLDVQTTASSSSPGLLPTPDAYEASRGGSQHPDKRRAGGHSVSLQGVTEHVLPTPTARDWKGHNQRQDDSCLTGALLPTPRATDGTKGGPNQRGSSGDLMLPSAVMLLPTPTVGNVQGGNKTRSGARADEYLLPGLAVAISTGALSGQPSTDGNEPSDE